MSEAVTAPAVSHRALLREAWDNLLSLRQRSALALLGIAIGAASVVAMLSIGHMAGKAALKPFLAMGVDLLSVQATSDGLMQPLPLDKVMSLPRVVPGVVTATGFARGRDDPPSDPTQPPSAVLAALPNLQSLAGLHVAEGRFLADVDADSLVAVVGAALAHPAGPNAAPLRLGDKVRVGRYVYRVVGILAPAPQNSLSPADFDRTILIPLRSGRRSVGTVDPTAALVRIAPDVDEQAVAAAITSQLATGLPGEQVTIQNARQVVAAVKAQKANHTRLLAALGGVALLVGGLGVMNVMLMSLMERRQEIGLRAALGATPRDIQLMFLAEAALLGAVGGVLGGALGVVSALIAAKVSHWPFAISLSSLPLGTGTAIAVALTFGLYPAVKAARLDPVEALRAE